MYYMLFKRPKIDLHYDIKIKIMVKEIHVKMNREISKINEDFAFISWPEMIVSIDALVLSTKLQRHTSKIHIKLRNKNA